MTLWFTSVPCLVAALLCCVTAFVNAAEPPAIGQHEDNIYMLAFSPDGRRLASASGDHTAVLRDAVDGAHPVVLQHDAPVYAALYSPDGKYIATADGTGHVRLWSSGGKLLTEQKQHQDAVYALAFSPDGSLLASAGGGGNGGDTRCLIWNASDLTLRRELAGHTRAVYGLVFRSGNQTLISGSSDKTIRSWSIDSGRSEVFSEHTSDVYRCDLSPDGQWLVSGGQDQHVRLRHLSRAETLSLAPVSRDPVYGALFTADGRFVVAVGDDARLHVWRNLPGFPHVSSTRISRQALYAVAVSPDSRSVVVAGADDRIYPVALPTDASGK